MRTSPPDPVLIVGGSGLVGSLAARTLRRFQPQLPIAIAGRDLARATAVAEAVGNAHAVQVDLQRRDLGLPHGAPYSAVVVFVKDDTLNTLRFAQDRGVPHIGVSSGSFEIAPEVAQFIHRPGAAPVLMLSHWLAGAASLPALHFMHDFETVDSIEIGAVLDEHDVGGPAAHADLERLTIAAPHAQVLEQGRWVWAQGELSTRQFTGVDGTVRPGQAYSPLDVVSLAAATAARRVRLDIAIGESEARRRGQPYSTEIVIEIEGVLKTGAAARVRHDIVHPQGQAPLTAAGVAVAVERLLGLDGGAPVPPGLYLPDMLMAPARMVQRMQDVGAVFSRR
jgi:hypothetical protein